jgi:hypothetical protein
VELRSLTDWPGLKQHLENLSEKAKLGSKTARNELKQLNQKRFALQVVDNKDMIALWATGVNCEISK